MNFLERLGRQAAHGPSCTPRYPWNRHMGSPEAFYKRFMKEANTCRKEGRPPTFTIVNAIKTRKIDAAMEEMGSNAFAKTVYVKAAVFGIVIITFAGGLEYLEKKTGMGGAISSILSNGTSRGLELAWDFITLASIPVLYGMGVICKLIKHRIDTSKVISYLEKYRDSFATPNFNSINEPRQN